MKTNKNDILKIEFEEDVPISKITTYKTDGTIKGLFSPKNEKEFIITYSFLKENNLPFIIIGNGSNLLISPSANILAISTKKLRQNIQFQEDTVRFSASVSLAKAYSLCCHNQLRSFEALAGIPATIGGAIKNNASAFGQSIFDNLEWIKIFKDGKISILKKENISFSYHSTNIKDCIILSAKFKLKTDKSCKITQDFVNFQKIRFSKQPKGLSCGSVFKNPPNHSAGQLIEKCNLKGTRHGKAVISLKHANFILNEGEASFDDVFYLIKLCQKSVKEKFDIELEPEVEIIK